MRNHHLRPALAIPQIYLYRAPIDSRKQVNGLAVLIGQELGHNPFTGALYAFTNRQSNKIKCLMWEDNGFVVCHWGVLIKIWPGRKKGCYDARHAKSLLASAQAVVPSDVVHWGEWVRG